MDSSSGSDTGDRARGHRSRRRDAHNRHGRDSRRVNGIGTGTGCEAANITDKISTLASTLQDTSRNLNKVDHMLGQYREHTDDQAEAMAVLRENLEESIHQLQTNRLGRSAAGARSASASASTLCTSDLETGSASDTQRFYPTSPLKDYKRTAGRRRRAHSSSVRFKDTGLQGEDIHVLHQTFRDLRCDQERLSHDLDREILRRNRADIDTRRAMENLTEHLTVSQRQDSVPSHVERRLEELEKEVQAERQNGDRVGRPHQRREGAGGGAAAGDRLEMEQELQRTRLQLERTEGSRDSLLQQVEDLRAELVRAGKEYVELHRSRLDLQREAAQPSAQLPAHHTDRREREYSELEKEVASLRAEMSRSSVLGEVAELKAALERGERERLRLCAQVEEVTSDLARREQQQLRMLEQLREIQSTGQAEKRESEALLQESSRSREELRTRAQEAVRQWRAKCKKLQAELKEAREEARLHGDKASQVLKEKEILQAQLKALSQQAEAARRELADVLGRLARREEELHRRGVELCEAGQRHLALEQEIREVREASAALEKEAQRQAALQADLREENRRLEEQASAQARRSQRDQETRAEELASTRVQLTQLAQRLAEEQGSGGDLRRSAAELRGELSAAQKEAVSLGLQMQLERDVHQRKLEGLKAAEEASGAKREREVQEARETLRLCRRERDELKARLQEVKEAAASDMEMCRALRLKLDRMKEECDKLAVELGAKEEANTLLHRKYQQLRQEVEQKAQCEEKLSRGSQAELAALGERISGLEVEQEVLLSSVGEELDDACRSLARDGGDKLQAITQKPELAKDPHRWLAETKTKLRWLCEEVRERGARELRLKKQHQQTREQLKAVAKSRDSEQATLLQRLDRQEKLLRSLNSEKKELLDRSRRKEEEMRSLQDRVLDLEMSTRVALDHLESVPEKLCLVENFKDLEECQRQREAVQQRYAKYKEIIWELQHQLDESKRKIHEYRDKKLDATSRSLRLAAFSATTVDSSASLRPDAVSTHKRMTKPELDAPQINGLKTATNPQHNLNK